MKKTCNVNIASVKRIQMMVWPQGRGKFGLTLPPGVSQVILQFNIMLYSNLRNPSLFDSVQTWQALQNNQTSGFVKHFLYHS